MDFFKTYKWLAPMLLFTVALVLVRFLRSASLAFVFIPFNMLLAVVPLFFSHMLGKTKNRGLAWLCFVMWLLFFPNAMYIVTDLFHLKPRAMVPQWFDLLLLFSAALNGIVIGYLSLHDVERFLRHQLHKRLVAPAILAFFLLCGYGVYLGRYLRWNSWDVITQPFSLSSAIFQDVAHPFRHQQCWLLTAIFGTWLYLMYQYFKKFGMGRSFGVEN